MNTTRSPMVHAGHERRGAALVLALICVLVATMVSGVLVKTALVQRDQLERDGWRSQAGWLAYSGRERSLALLQTQADYAGDTWLPAAADGTTIGRVVAVVADDAAAGRVLRLTVDVPDHPVERVRVVRIWRLPPGESSINVSDPAVDESVAP